MSEQADLRPSQTVRSFDHTGLMRHEHYQALRDGLTAFMREDRADDLSFAQVLDLLRDLASAWLYGDVCDRCRDQGRWGRWPDGNAHFPVKIERRADNRLVCEYFCPRCELSWTCFFAVGAHDWDLTP